MPDWAWALLSLPIIGVLAKIAYDHRASTKAEKRADRREGAAVVTPVEEIIAAHSPGALMWGDQQALSDHLRKWHEKWMAQRQALMTYANAHRGEPIYGLAEKVVQAVNAQQAAGMFLVQTHFSNVPGQDAYETSRDRTEEAEAAVKALLDAIP